MRSDPFSPVEHAVRWRNGKAGVPYACPCGETVHVEGVTTPQGAVAELRRLGQHQH